MKGRTLGLHHDRQLETARNAFVDLCGQAKAFTRSMEIECLPTVQWKGRTLYTIRCHGERGKGPHDCNVPEALLWALIEVRAYTCPYHV